MWVKWMSSFNLHGAGHVVPDKVRVVTEGDEGETDSSGDGVGEQRDGLDDRPHVLGGLRGDVNEIRAVQGDCWPFQCKLTLV